MIHTQLDLIQELGKALYHIGNCQSALLLEETLTPSAEDMDDKLAKLRVAYAAVENIMDDLEGDQL